MMVQQALSAAKTILNTTVELPALEAELLLAFVLDQSRAALHAQPQTMLTSQQAERFALCLEQRQAGMPFAYIVGKKEFWSLELVVNPETLIPRPETELLVELALATLPTSLCHVADMGTGSGAIALALKQERHYWQLYATDISPGALSTAQQNAKRLGLTISFHQGHWCHALPSVAFDMIISNPPYISEAEWPAFQKGLSYEPRAALVSGAAGLTAIQEIILSAKSHLKPSGLLMLEHGANQGRAVREIFTAAGYYSICSQPDLSGAERVTVGCKAASRAKM